MSSLIQAVADLENVVGATPEAVILKVIDHVDAHAQRWLAVSPLGFMGFSDEDQVDITLMGGPAGFATMQGPTQLRLPRASLDDPGHAMQGRGAGMLFVIPGLGETLRINGTVDSVSDEHVMIAVQECYAHCAKALLRSEFWQAPAATKPAANLEDFLAACRFMALATADAALRADVSPKGDPAGALVRGNDAEIRFADRPGNRRTDSLRNLLSRPHAAAVLMVPGCTQIAVVRGTAQLSTDPALLREFIVQDKTPKLVTRLDAPTIMLRDSAALSRAAPALWNAPTPPAGIDPAALFAAHVKSHKAGGLRAALMKAAVFPGMIRKRLAQDYKHNMY